MKHKAIGFGAEGRGMGGLTKLMNDHLLFCLEVKK